MFEPSTTVFLIACNVPTGCAFNIAETTNAISTASLSCSNGGCSSNSIKPAFGVFTYTKLLFLLVSNLAAMSIFPPSPLAALSFLLVRTKLEGNVSIV